MAALNPLGFLILYIALAAAPQNEHQVTIRLGESMEILLESRDDGWWVRNDNSGITVAYKREGTKLLARQDKDQQDVDLATYYKITGDEDFSESQVIEPQDKTDLTPVQLEPSGDRMLVKSGSKKKAEQATILWGRSE